MSQTIQSHFPSIWLSVVNYFAVCVMSAIAMAFVMGGSILKINEAEKVEPGEDLWLVYFLCHNLDPLC